MKSRIKSLATGNAKVLVAVIVVALAAGTTGAVGADLIKSGDIQNGSIKLKDLQKKVRKQIKKKGAVGTGQAGPQGPAGQDGADADFEAGNWGVINRNTIGSPDVELRSGPFGSFGVTGAVAAPPYGEGSLGISVADNATTLSPPSEKASFGNEVDFFGDLLSGVSEVGFHVFQTGENAGISPSNLPNITFEVDANLASLPADNYSSLAWVPDPAPFTGGASWTGYMDAASTGKWYFTGAEGAASGCTSALVCDWDDVQTAIADGGADASIYTLAVGKGRDSRWSGAVDGLRINGDVFDFEPLGVEVTTP